MENIQLTPEMLATIPGIVLLLQLLKNIPMVAKISVWMPLISIGLGVACALLAKMGATIQAQVLAGFVMGIAAAGGYDTVKKLQNPTPTQ